MAPVIASVRTIAIIVTVKLSTNSWNRPAKLVDFFRENHFIYHSVQGSNQSRTSPNSSYAIGKSDSPSRKRRRVSSRQSPTSSIWEQRQSPRNTQSRSNYDAQHSPLLRRRLRDSQQQQQRSWEQIPSLFQQTPSPPHQQQQQRSGKNRFFTENDFENFQISTVESTDDDSIEKPIPFASQNRNNSSNSNKTQLWLKWMCQVI